MHIRDYIHATYDLLLTTDDSGSVLVNLKKYLENRGLQKFHPRILKGLMEKLRRRERNGNAKVIVAREADLKKHKNTIDEALTRLGVTGEYHVQVDETIIGGFIVKGKNERVDTSHKSTLLHAYHRLTDTV